MRVLSNFYVDISGRYTVNNQGKSWSAIVAAHPRVPKTYTTFNRDGVRCKISARKLAKDINLLGKIVKDWEAQALKTVKGITAELIRVMHM